MDSKKNIKGEVGAVLEALTQKINSIKEQVDKLCENTECFENLCDKSSSKVNKEDLKN